MSTVHSSDILMVPEKSTFEELKENLHHGLFSVSQNQIFRYVCVQLS